MRELGLLELTTTKKVLTVILDYVKIALVAPKGSRQSSLVNQFSSILYKEENDELENTRKKLLTKTTEYGKIVFAA